jgi:hypothetical protein
MKDKKTQDKIDKEFSFIDAKLKESFSQIKKDIDSIKKQDKGDTNGRDIDELKKEIKELKENSEKEKKELRERYEKRLQYIGKKDSKREIAFSKSIGKGYEKTLDKFQKRFGDLEKENKRLKKNKKIKPKKTPWVKDLLKTIFDKHYEYKIKKTEKPKQDPKTTFEKERKTFFGFILFSFLALSIISIFKHPNYFPGLSVRTFWSLVIFAGIIFLYYVGFFNFIKKLNELNTEYMKNKNPTQNTKKEKSNNKKINKKSNNKNNNKYKDKNLFSRTLNRLSESLAD